jgi:NADH-quinone oxidoreductase E subunit
MNPNKHSQTLSPKILGEFEAVASKYPTRRAALLPLLWIIQREEGALSDEAIAAAAELTECSAAQVLETVEFYTMFHREKVGRFHLQVCRTLSCDLVGAGDLHRTVERLLALKEGGVTADGMFSYQPVECLACCHAGPCLSVNDERHENMTAQKLEELIESLRRS